METLSANAFGRTSTSASISLEGQLCAPPALVQKHLSDSGDDTPFWLAPSPVSDPAHELETLRQAWQELAAVLANQPAPQVPEVFQMPAASKTPVRMRVQKINPAPFVFVDDLAE